MVYIKIKILDAIFVIVIVINIIAITFGVSVFLKTQNEINDKELYNTYNNIDKVYTQTNTEIAEYNCVVSSLTTLNNTLNTNKTSVDDLRNYIIDKYKIDKGLNTIDIMKILKDLNLEYDLYLLQNDNNKIKLLAEDNYLLISVNSKIYYNKKTGGWHSLIINGFIDNNYLIIDGNREEQQIVIDELISKSLDTSIVLVIGVKKNN